MTISIIETVTAAGLSFSFAAVQDQDLGVLGVEWDSDGIGASGVSLPDWNGAGGTGEFSAYWKELDAGETTHTLTGTHTLNEQIVAVLLRNDTIPGTPPGLDEAASGGTTVVTDDAGSAVLAFTAAESGYGELTSAQPFTLHANTSNLALWRHVPLTVPAGTTLRVDGPGATNAIFLYAFRPWGFPVEPPVPGGGGWNVWIID